MEKRARHSVCSRPSWAPRDLSVLMDLIREAQADPCFKNNIVICWGIRKRLADFIFIDPIDNWGVWEIMLPFPRLVILRKNPLNDHFLPKCVCIDLCWRELRIFEKGLLHWFINCYPYFTLSRQRDSSKQRPHIVNILFLLIEAPKGRISTEVIVSLALVLWYDELHSVACTYALKFESELSTYVRYNEMGMWEI